MNAMFERFDQSELLALIEGELDPRAAAALQQRLASDPQAAAAVESMRLERALLRDLPEPALPHDFIAAIEPMLSRPMLIETAAEIAALKPGEFRRRHQRATRRMRPMRLAAAAAVLLAVLGGSWAVVDALVRSSPTRNGDDRLARNTPQNNSATPTRSVAANTNDAAQTSDVLGPGVVHHSRPMRLGDGTSFVALARQNGRDASTANGSGDIDSRTAPRQPAVLAADFTIVLASADAQAAESRVAGALADLGARAALVRNFSYQEAQVLAEDYRLAHGGSPRASRDDRMAGSGSTIDRAPAPSIVGPDSSAIAPDDIRLLAQNVRDQIRETATASRPDLRGGQTISGTESLAPTLEQQLDFSSRGATLTIAVPASELIALVERLALSDPASGAPMLLRMLSTERTADDATPASSTNQPAPAAQPALVWLTEGPLVRQSVQRLSSARGEVIVLVPVTLK